MLARPSVTFQWLKAWDWVLAGEIGEVWSRQICWNGEVVGKYEDQLG